MESVVIREKDDLSNVSSDTTEIEFVQFDLSVLDEEYLKNIELHSITFTNMDVDLDDLNYDISELSFYNCNIYHEDTLDRFLNLTTLEVTNYKVDCALFINMRNLKSLNVNYSEVINCEELKRFSCLEEISIIGSSFDFSILLGLNHLKTLIIDEAFLDKEKEVVRELSTRGVIIMNMMGGCYHVL